MKKRRILSLLLFFSEMGILFLLHRISVPYRTVSFLRYSFMYFMLGVIFGRFQCNTNLIWDEIKRIILCNSSFFLATNVMNSLRMWTVPYMLWNLLISVCMSLAAILLNRYYRIWFRKWLAQDVVIIGTDEEAETLAFTYGTNRFALSKIVAVVDCNNSKLLPDVHQEFRIHDDYPVIPFDELAAYLDSHTVDEIVIALPEETREEMQVIYDIVNHRVNVVKSLPKVNGIITYQSQVEDFDGIVLISSSVGPMHHNKPGLVLKRAIDILIGLIGVIALLPLSLYVKLQFLKEGDKGPIFFKQERIGYRGRKFMLYKYRSMVPDAEKILDELMEQDPAIKEEYETNKKLEHDPRVTAIGEKIRRSSIDEFPQFINVLKGDMSFVGPRPYLPREQEDMGQYYETVTACKPGITGMWQTHGRSETSFEQRLAYDDYYYRNWSIWLDLTILVKTFKTVSSNTGAI